MAQVTFYNNASNNHVFNPALTQLAQFDVYFKDQIDVENPDIYVQNDASIINANYCYIPQFGRYYHCKAVGDVNQTIHFICQSDPLVSFKSAILASPAVIARNPWKYDKYIHDEQMPLESRTVRGTFKFPGNHFDGNNNSYILTTLGSGSATNSGDNT